MSVLTRKLLRDLRQLWGQIAAIILVLGAGIMTLIVSNATLDALEKTQADFYQSQAFGQVFADLKRAPNALADRVANLSGVNQVETRIQAPMRLAVAGFEDPIRGMMVSLPDGRQPTISRLYLRAGRLPQAGRSDEVVVSDGFALAHGLQAGDQVEATVVGRSQRLTITGIALSPEFIYQRSPADLFPDHLRYGVMWMNRSALANAYGMEGAFNQLVLTHQPQANPQDLIDAIDQWLKPYGGTGAYDRMEHMSHRFLAEEIKQLQVMGLALPVIFLGVAAFLLNILLSRVLSQQRQDIAMLKAFGYGPIRIAWHYTKMTGLIVVVGAVLGTGLGAWAADGMAAMYLDFFRFPDMPVHLAPQRLAQGIGVAGGAALLGTWRAIGRTMRLAPAEAMQPPTPKRYRPSLLERLPGFERLSQSARMVTRHLARHRFKVTFSVIGISLSGALLLVGSYQFSATDHLLDVQFRLIERADLRLVFTDPTPEQSLVELNHLPGVLHAEGYRAVPVRLRHRHLSYRTSILGLDPASELHVLLDEQQQPHTLPEEGLVLSDYLAQLLALRVGDAVWVELLEGEQESRLTPVVATVSDWVGVSAYMNRSALNTWLGEGPTLSGAWLLTDGMEHGGLFDRLWSMPKVAGVGVVHLAESQIRSFIDDTILIMMGVLLLLAGGIAFGVIYNNARLSFAERSRELATLRVLGYSQSEVSFILIGELAILTALAIPLGWLLGWLMAHALTQTFSMELMRIPFIVSRDAYALSALGVITASVISIALIGPRLYRLDMVLALKTVE